MWSHLQEEAAAAGRKQHVSQLRGQISEHEAVRKRAEAAKMAEGRELQRKQAQDKAIVEVSGDAIQVASHMSCVLKQLCAHRTAIASVPGLCGMQQHSASFGTHRDTHAAHQLTWQCGVQAAKQRKLAEMAAMGVPEKYRAELARFRPMS